MLYAVAETGVTDHHPPHTFVDGTWHMVTAATVGHARYLASESAKEYWRDSLQLLTGRAEVTVLAWVVLDDHYHVLIRPKRGEAMGRLFAQLHGRASRAINSTEGVAGRQVWHNYWDRSILSERDLWLRFNYIHGNPVKHGYVSSPHEWHYSSFGYYWGKKGAEWLVDCEARFPTIDFTPSENEL